MTEEEIKLIEKLEELFPAFHDRISFLCSYIVIDSLRTGVLPMSFNHGLDLTKAQYNKHFQEHYKEKDGINRS